MMLATVTNEIQDIFLSFLLISHEDGLAWKNMDDGHLQGRFRDQGAAINGLRRMFKGSRVLFQNASISA